MPKKFSVDSTLLCTILLILAVNTCTAQFAPRKYYGAKFEPEAQIIHGAGQSDEFAFANYIEAVGTARHPMLYMEYLRVQNNSPELIEELLLYREILGHYPADVGLQLGLSMNRGGVAFTDDVVSGMYDEGLEIIVNHLDSLNRKVFVRIGYEANGFWNGYKSASYKAAFQYVTNFFRSKSDSIATVWCVHPVDNITKIMGFYPGDDFVDWWSIDLFQTEFILNKATSDFMRYADEHGKPVIIGEANPTYAGVGEGQKSWDNWYVKFFNVIQKNGGIKGFCYINRDWAYLGSLPDWGNSKIQDDSIVNCMFRKELDNDIYLHSNATAENNVSTVVSVADSYVDSKKPLDNFGKEGKMFAKVSGNDSIISFLKFDLSALPLGEISLVQLWLLGACNHADEQDIDVFLTGNNWNEDEINWDNKPALLQKVGTINVNDDDKTSIYSVDISQLTIDAITNGNGIISFAIQQPAVENIEYFFHTREKAPAYPPTLQIIHNSVAMAIDPCNDETTSAQKISSNTNEIGISIYPNPSTGTIFIEGFSAQQNLMRIEFYNLQGAKVKTMDFENNAQPATKQIPDLGLPSGTYYMQLYYTENSKEMIVGRKLLLF
jgi:hypothetical protein